MWTEVARASRSLQITIPVGPLVFHSHLAVVDGVIIPIDSPPSFSILFGEYYAPPGRPSTPPAAPPGTGWTPRSGAPARGSWAVHPGHDLTRAMRAFVPGNAHRNQMEPSDGNTIGTVGRSCGVWSARMPCWRACNRAATSRDRARGRPTRPSRQGPLASTPRAAASFRPPFRPPLGPAARRPDPPSSHSEKLVGHGKIKYTRQTI